MGLAQLYQLRGRVGRSKEQAFAFLFVPSGALLSDRASSRLTSLVKCSALGSGYRISLDDLKQEESEENTEATNS